MHYRLYAEVVLGLLPLALLVLLVGVPPLALLAPLALLPPLVFAWLLFWGLAVDFAPPLLAPFVLVGVDWVLLPLLVFILSV